MSTDPNPIETPNSVEASTEGRSDASARDGGRDSLFLAAQLRVGTAHLVTVRVRNLSEGGLMAELPYALHPDARVEIDVRGLGWIKGRIAWQTGGRAGIAFDEVVDPQRARKPVGATAKPPSMMRPTLPPR